MLSNARPLPSQLIRIAAALSRLVNSVLVNCTRLFTVKDLRSVHAQCPIQRFQAEAGIHGDRYFPGQDIATEPIDDRYQVDEAPLEADVGDITTPDLIAALNGHSSESSRDTSAPSLLARWYVVSGRSLPDPSVAATAAHVCVPPGSPACATRPPSCVLHRTAFACIAHPTSASATGFPHFLPLAYGSNSIWPSPTACTAE